MYTGFLPFIPLWQHSPGLPFFWPLSKQRRLWAAFAFVSRWFQSFWTDALTLGAGATTGAVAITSPAATVPWPLFASTPASMCGPASLHCAPI